MTDERQQALWQRGRFRVTATGLEVRGTPSCAEWARALAAATHVRSATQWGTGDMLLYADERRWDAEEVEAAMDATGLKRGTLQNLKGVARRFPKARRNPRLPWSHHAAVASLSDDDADALLAASEEQGWGWEEVSAQARDRRNRQRRLEQAWPEGTYGLVLAEPPWARTVGLAAGLTTDGVAALAPRVQAISAPGCLLYLAVPGEMAEDGFTVLRAWGFAACGTMALVSGVARRSTDYVRERHELVLIGRRGAAVPPEQPLDSVVHVPDLSVRLALVRQLEQAFPAVPRVRLFTDEATEGWASWGLVLEDEQPPERAISLRESEVPA